MRRFTPFHSNKDIDPDEIFLDDKNIPEFDVHQFEGRIERPIRERTIIFVALFFVLIGLVLTARAGILEVRDDRFNGLGPFSDDRGAAARGGGKLRFEVAGFAITIQSR